MGGRLVRSGPNGSSDISGILVGGRRLEIELKSSTGRVSPEQKAWIEMINSMGGLAFVARSVEEVIDELR